MLGANVLNWFEIPARDLNRAAAFYEAVLGAKLPRDTMEGVQMALFLNAAGEPGGCLVAMPGYRPSEDGTTVYFNLKDDLAEPLSRVRDAGGTLMRPKTALPENMGFYAQFCDCEGNRVGLFSPR